MSEPKYEPYTPEQAEAEAALLKEKIASHRAHSYEDAERLVELEQLPREEKLARLRKEYNPSPTAHLSNFISHCRDMGLEDIAEKAEQVFLVRSFSLGVAGLTTLRDKLKNHEDFSKRELSDMFHDFDHRVTYALDYDPKKGVYSEARDFLSLFCAQDEQGRRLPSPLDTIDSSLFDKMRTFVESNRAQIIELCEELLRKASPLEAKLVLGKENRELEEMLGITPEAKSQ